MIVLDCGWASTFGPPPTSPGQERLPGKLQRLRAAKLVAPVGAEHRDYGLTELGKRYWRLLASGAV